MRNLKRLTLAGLCFGLCLAFVPLANAAPRWGVQIGVGPGYYVDEPPVCPYGYYPYYPYACVPYGYYGPEWFSGGVFIGAGPWAHGYHGHGHYYAGRGEHYANRGGHGAYMAHGRAPAMNSHPAFRGGNRGGGGAHRGGRR